MAWDLQIDLQTGDIKFNSILDFGSCQAENLIQQRIHNRLKIPRGSFLYDVSGTLGSRLLSLLDMGVPKSEANVEMLIREALSSMDDIVVTGVDVNFFNDGSNMVSDPRVIKATIHYEAVFLSNDALSPNSPSQFSTQVAIPA